MLLIKIAVTIIIVTGMSIVAERVSPRAAGILSGYPLGTAISLFFIGMEQGPAYAGASALYAVAGMAALLSFLYCYYLGSVRVQRFSILAGSLAAIGGFLVVDGLLLALPLPAWASLLIAGGAILGFGVLFRGIPNAKIANRIRLGPKVLFFRASLAALIIVGIIGAAKIVPASLAGLFSAFPSTVFPLVLIIHHTYGPKQAHTIIKNLPTGLWSLVLYTLTISFAYPRLGIYWGTLAGYVIATLYLLGLAAVQWNKKRDK
ncbi:MAG: hypothetical protein IH586_02730 [Anaerolineaceae bacterium]|nr:hypothetical protein [Anaerolineaceae bacterium]